MPYQHVRPVPVVAMSLTKAAASTGLRVERISDAVKNGELRAHRIGTKTRITCDALRQWIDSHPPASRNRQTEQVPCQSPA